jgi:hypothetical protein
MALEPLFLTCISGRILTGFFMGAGREGLLEAISKIENTRVASNPWHPKGRNFLENRVPLLACKQCETIFEMASRPVRWLQGFLWVAPIA